MPELPPREKSQRISNRAKTQNNTTQDGTSITLTTSSGATGRREVFQLYKNPQRVISNINELLPGLNDISDAFEALPLDLIKYFTLLKEIDAKCINTIPQINQLISNYIKNLHQPPPSTSVLANGTTNSGTGSNSSANDEEFNKRKNLLESKRLITIKNKINEIIPCLEEKMHVTSVASDLLNKHMIRINQDYKLILLNNEIPESIRIGPLNHPAMINDAANGNTNGTTNGNTNGNGNNSSQSQRSESRREALAARKANKEDDSNSNTTGNKKKKKETSPNNDKNNTNSGNTGGSGNSTTKKRNRDDAKSGNSNTANNNNNNNGGNGNTGGNNTNSKKKQKKQEYEDDNDTHDVSSTSINQNKKSNDTHDNSNTKIKSTNNSNSNSINNANASSTGGGNSGNNEPTYCYCNQVSFGEMVGCDGDDCKREWFHLPCIGYKNPPKGKWYCDDCLAKMKKVKKV